MMKTKEKQARLYRQAEGLDEYGQEKDEKEFLGEITGSLLEYQRQINHVSPVYDEVTKVFVTDFQDVSDNCFLEVEGKTYSVKYAPDRLRKKVVYLG